MRARARVHVWVCLFTQVEVRDQPARVGSPPSKHARWTQERETSWRPEDNFRDRSSRTFHLSFQMGFLTGLEHQQLGQAS